MYRTMIKSLKYETLRTILLLSILFVEQFVFASSGDKQVEEKEPLKIPRIEGGIKVDGFIDEEIWSEALKIDANIEVEPGENIPAPVKTEVYLTYDNSKIYVAFKAFDPDPTEIRANYCDRDNIWNDDWVLILFDTFNDERRCYDFGCNALGIQADIVESTSGGGSSWDAIWESDGRITEEGYVVEMAIPFSALKFPRKEGEQIWGFDAVRSYPRNVRHHIGSFPRDRDNNCYFCQLEKIIGFSDVIPGKDIELVPTFTSLVAQERESEHSGPFITDDSYGIGLTSSWGITNNLKLSATLNPDFSTIEADVVQVDVNNPFELWYPEKRPFFLEGEDFFKTSINAVHTRILADPNFGVKLIGKEGKNTIGFFSCQDAITNLVIPSLDGSTPDTLYMKSYGTVFRYLRDFGQSSNVGLLLTDREGENYYNRVLGFDGLVRLNRSDNVRGQVLGSRTLYPDQPADGFWGNGIKVNYSHDTKKYNFFGTYEQMSPGFRTDLGFVNQTGYRCVDVGGNYIWREGPERWFTWMNFYLGADIWKDYGNNTVRRELKANFNYNGPLQSYFGVYGQVSRNVYKEEFNTSFLNYWVGGQPLKWFSFNLWSVFGNQIDYDNAGQGRGLQLGISATFKIGSRLSIYLDHYYDRLNVDDDSLNVENGRLYTANREYIKLMYHFNERIFIRAIFQYAYYRKDPSLYLYEEVEPQEQELLTQILFSYKIDPHTALYIGYSDNYYGDDDIDIIQTDRSLFVKIGYAWMF